MISNYFIDQVFLNVTPNTSVEDLFYGANHRPLPVNVALGRVVSYIKFYKTSSQFLSLAQLTTLVEVRRSLVKRHVNECALQVMIVGAMVLSMTTVLAALYLPFSWLFIMVPFGLRAYHINAFKALRGLEACEREAIQLIKQALAYFTALNDTATTANADVAALQLTLNDQIASIQGALMEAGQGGGQEIPPSQMQLLAQQLATTQQVMRNIEHSQAISYNASQKALYIVDQLKR